MREKQTYRRSAKGKEVKDGGKRRADDREGEGESRSGSGGREWDEVCDLDLALHLE
jgi:hypothetical protein